MGALYDDVFRTLLNDCSPLIIPGINEAFVEKHYTGKEIIVFSPNEHFLTSRMEQKRNESQIHVLEYW